MDTEITITPKITPVITPDKNPVVVYTSALTTVVSQKTTASALRRVARLLGTTTCWRCPGTSCAMSTLPP